MGLDRSDAFVAKGIMSMKRIGHKLVLLVLCVALSPFSTNSARAQFGYPAADAGRTRDPAAPTTYAAPPGSFGWGVATPNTVPSGGTINTASPDWRLGVTVDNTPNGVVLRTVQAGSAAERAGLEAGDIILTVGGYQVGYVDGKLFDIGEEIRRRVDGQGRVRMLVQDVRTTKVNLMDVGLQNTSVAVRGDVVWRDPRVIPAGAILQVRVDNVTRPYQAVSGGSVSVSVLQNQPIPFEMYIDPAYLVAGERYQIQASIVSAGQVLYSTPQPIAIDPTRGPINGLRLELAPAGVVTAGGTYTTAYPPNSQLITSYYQKYLNRVPNQAELTAWLEYFARGKSVDDLPVTLLSSAEFYERSGGTDARFIEQMFLSVVQRRPSNEEMTRWLQQLQRLGPQGRNQAVRDFWMSANRK
jgi:uncharacterized lipoprotein YbaY